MRALELSLAAAMLGGAFGCTIRTADLTLVATQNVPALTGDVRGAFEGSDCKVFGVVNLEEAIDRAIEKGNGNALKDAVLYLENYPFVTCFRAKGTVMQVKENEQ